MLQLNLQDITTDAYVTLQSMSEEMSGTSIITKPKKMAVVVADRLVSCLCVSPFDIFQQIIKPDIISTLKFALESRTETATLNLRLKQENALLQDILKSDRVISMPPIKEYSLNVKIKSVEKPGPQI
jgi:hypothetical protein